MQDNRTTEQVVNEIVTSAVEEQGKKENNLQKRIYQMERRKAEVKKFFEEYEALLAEVEEEFGLSYHFQDEDGHVYQTVQPEWKNVRMEHFGIIRTRFEGERAGTLSMPKAKELGYEDIPDYK